MGAKVSAEMVKAKSLVLEGGATAYAAAKATGLTVGAISRTKWYRDHVAAQPIGDDLNARARALVVDQGMSAYAAAKALGIAQSTISRSGWYRDHIDELVNAFKPGGRHAP
jgi:molybdopterin-binding protein